MNEKLLTTVVILSVASVGFSWFLGFFGRKNDAGYDERQLIERGRGAEFAMMTAVCYLLMLVLPLEFEWLDMASLSLLAVWGLVLVMTAFNACVIFHDAYLRQGQEAGAEILRGIAFGVIWVAIARGFNGEWSWVQLAIAFDYFSEGLMLLIRTLYLRLRDRGETDG